MTPRQYQKDALEKFSKLKHPRMPLFWQMRLGKSPTVIWAIQQYFDKDWQNRKHLIVCPKTTIISWEEEFRKHNINPLVFTSQNKSFWDRFYLLGNFFITNYEAITSQFYEDLESKFQGYNETALARKHWDSIVLDESQRLRNINTKTSIAFTQRTAFPFLPEKAIDPSGNKKEQFRAVLSGTPMPENMQLDVFQQIKFLYGRLGRFKDYYQFKDECFEPDDIRGSYKWRPKFGFLQAWAEFDKKYCFTLSRSEAGVNIPNIYEKRFVELSQEAREKYSEFEASWFVEFTSEFIKLGGEFKDFKKLEAQFAVAAQNYLHQLACGFPKEFRVGDYHATHKYDEVASLLTEDLLEEKVVIWCRYSREIEYLKENLEKLGRRVESLTGGMYNFEVSKIIERFRKPNSEKGALDTVVCQLKKASLGMDLSAADTQIFFSRSWSATENIQALDRLISVGRKEDGILTIDIIAQDTIDEDLYWALVDKKANASIFKLFLKRTQLNLNSISSQFLAQIENYAET